MMRDAEKSLVERLRSELGAAAEWGRYVGRKNGEPAYRDQPWFSRALSAFAVILNGEDVELVFADHGHGDNASRLFVWTADTLAVAAVKDVLDADEVPMVSTVPRRSIVRLDVSAGELANVADEPENLGDPDYAKLWPGEVVVRAHYPQLSKHLELRGPGMDEGEPTVVTPIRRVLAVFRVDLGHQATS